MNKRVLVIFDFDHTITTRDTLTDFIIYYFGKVRFVLGLFYCSVPLFFYFLKVIPKLKMKEFILTYFFKDIQISEFTEKCQKYSKKRLPSLINKIAFYKIKFHIESGHKTIIVSASPHYWYHSWANENGITKIISTKLEVADEKLTGRIKGSNCYGIEKLKMLIEAIDLSEFDYIYMYGDSKGDHDLINFSNEGYIKFKRVK